MYVCAQGNLWNIAATSQLPTYPMNSEIDAM